MFPVVLGLAVLAFKQGLVARGPVSSIVRPLAVSALAGAGVSRPRDLLLRPIRLAGSALGWALGLASSNSLAAVRDVAASAANDPLAAAPVVRTVVTARWVTVVIRKDVFNFIKVAASFSVVCLMVVVVYKTSLKVIFLLKDDSEKRWLLMEDKKQLEEFNRSRGRSVKLLPQDKLSRKDFLK